MKTLAEFFERYDPQSRDWIEQHTERLTSRIRNERPSTNALPRMRN
jgi:hypothetical protein